MSPTIRPVEMAPRPEIEVIDFEAIFEQLAVNMQKHDSLVAEFGILLDTRPSFAQRLEKVDLKMPIRHQPEDLARDALSLFIYDKQIDQVSEEIKEVCYRLNGFDYLFVRNGLSGRKVEITPTDPERHRLDWISKSDNGARTWQGSRSKPTKGKVEDFGLDLSLGGNIEITTRFGQLYSASPLIDRDNDYQPAFTIELI